MPAGFSTSSPSPDMVLVSLMKPVGSFGTSVSILLAASSSRCFLLFLPTQKNFDGSGIGGRIFRPAMGRVSFAFPAAATSSFSAASVCAPLVSAIFAEVAGTARCSTSQAATTSTISSPLTMPNRASFPFSGSTKVARRMTLLSSRQLHVVVLHDLAPFGNVGVDVAAEFLRRLRTRLRAQSCEMVAKFPGLHRRHDDRVDLVDDLGR